ncbi:MAG: PilZ domain-containing protein [Pseudomonadota bacterium]
MITPSYTHPEFQPEETAIRLSSKAAERRDHERIEVRARATAHAHGIFQTVLIRNVSRGGVMLDTAFGLAVGDTVILRTINGHAYPGRVAWSVSPYTGISFDDPIESDDPLFSPRHRVSA